HDCVVLISSSYDQPNANFAPLNGSPVREWNSGGTSFGGYDHTQIKLDYTNGTPTDATSGNELRGRLYARVLQDFAPRIVASPSSMSASGTGNFTASTTLRN